MTVAIMGAMMLVLMIITDDGTYDECDGHYYDGNHGIFCGGSVANDTNRDDHS